MGAGEKEERCLIAEAGWFAQQAVSMATEKHGRLHASTCCCGPVHGEFCGGVFVALAGRREGAPANGGSRPPRHIARAERKSTHLTQKSYTPNPVSIPRDEIDRVFFYITEATMTSIEVLGAR